ncbi:MAG TPA: four helix bundle protein [Spirochaetota bacterium]|nr:four helix bundle protein [Spirochaetota bacterium]
MSEIKTFEDLECWQYGRELTKLVYTCTASVVVARDYGFADQMRRAAISIMNNIAEGFERDTNTDFVRFLFIAKASAGEVRSMAYAGLDLKYFGEQQFNDITALSIRCSKTIWGLIKSLNKKSGWRAKISISILFLSHPFFCSDLPGFNPLFSVFTL